MLRNFVFVMVSLLLMSCNTRSDHKKIKYTTSADSTLIHYHKGWQEIMDFGDYAAAEVSYRKALEYDPNFLVGKSVLARLTLNLEERLALYQTVEDHKQTIQGNERLILDVYQALTKYTNLRDQKSEMTKSVLQEALNIGEYNFRKLVHEYPNEVYLKSEYIEILHAQYGAKRTLDSMQVLVTKRQGKTPFLLGYKAILTAETKNFKDALVYAQALAEQMKDVKAAKPDAILADIYFKMEDYKKAKIYADRAFNIDPRNLDASRLKEKIDKKLK